MALDGSSLRSTDSPRRFWISSRASCMMPSSGLHSSSSSWRKLSMRMPRNKLSTM